MSKTVLGKWLKKNVKERKKEYFPRIDLELEFEGLTWKEQKQLVKENTIKLPKGKEQFNSDDYKIQLIAKTLVAAGGEPLDLTDPETLKENGFQSTEDAVDQLFTVGEIARIMEIVDELAGTRENEEEEEIEELKN